MSTQNDKIPFAVSNICSSFDESTIGTKVTDREAFMAALAEATKKYDSSKDRVEGQHFIPLNEAIDIVSAGVGERTDNPADYIHRFYRGKVTSFLKRERAAIAETLNVVLYTKKAYLSDLDVDGTDETELLNNTDCSHVIVAVLASAGPKPQLSPNRFAHNLAGGNKEAQQWSADEIREKSKAVVDYDNKWCTVAD